MKQLTWHMCAHCDHPPHPDRSCQVLRVSGPPADNPHNRAYLHEGRTVTRCGCEQYESSVNGAVIV